MRLSASTAALVLGGSLVLSALVGAAAPGTALAVGSSHCAPLGLAGGYTEFVQNDSQRTADAEGAVAVGGDADFTQGFSLGAKLTAAEAAALPGGAALVVGGTLRLGSSSVEVEHGNAVYGALSGSGHVWTAGGSAAQGASPIDFAAAFTKLRAVSTAIGGLSATGSSALRQDGGNTVLTLTGTDPLLNVFTLTAAQLQAGKEIRIDVPAGSSTLVNVTGAAYDMDAAGTTAVFFKDPVGGGWHEEDYTEPNSALAGIRGSLLWNFPQAETVVKRDGTAWPGTLLAPNAAVHLGSGNVNGEVVAKSLTSAGGAETHHFTYQGCVPVPTSTTPGGTTGGSTGGTGTTGTTGSTTTGGTTGSTTGGTTGSGTTGGTSTTGGSTTGGTTGSGTSGTNGGTTSGGSTGTGGTTGGGLAHTGGGSDALPLLGAGAGVIVLGTGALVLTARRRKQGSTER